MTGTTNNTRLADTPMTREEVKRMLRDAAFVLHMTRRVKAEIMAERPELANRHARGKNQEMTAGLVV
ncbi:MAG TPA: hypothetical protein VLM40_21710 [Gemmata sp.]|nr:hypothetical protein [Gemmata sp.]